VQEYDRFLGKYVMYADCSFGSILPYPYAIVSTLTIFLVF